MTEKLTAADPTGPPVVTLVRLRPDLRTCLDLALYSDFEGKVPYGAISQFFNDLLSRYFTGTTPIAPYTAKEATACPTPHQQPQTQLSLLEDSQSPNSSPTIGGESGS
jgi:hypothetical protein